MYNVSLPAFMLVGDLPIEYGVVRLPVGADALAPLIQVDVLVRRDEDEVEGFGPIGGSDDGRAAKVVHYVSAMGE